MIQGQVLWQSKKHHESKIDLWLGDERNMPQETKKAVTKQGSGSVFFLIFNDIGKKGTRKSHSTKQDPVYNEQKDDCCLNQQSLRNPFGNFSQQHFLMEKWNFQNIINTITPKISDHPKNIVKIPTTFYLSIQDSKNTLSYSI